jgi:hypothetical protein
MQVETLFWLNFVPVKTCTGQNCTSFNLYICVVQVITCTKSQLVHNIYIGRVPVIYIIYKKTITQLQQTIIVKFMPSQAKNQNH